LLIFFVVGGNLELVHFQSFPDLTAMLPMENFPKGFSFPIASYNLKGIEELFITLLEV
jgi:hypothetical protein